MFKDYSTLEFRNCLISLINEVRKEREIAEKENKKYLEIKSLDRIKEPYVSMIRDYFVGMGYNVFFLKKLDITPYYNNYEITSMRLEWF